MNPAVLHMVDHVVLSISAHLMAGTNVGVVLLQPLMPQTTL